jgi:GrpB-like predicted nucleotidyltransferase (UPF0157 family)
MLTGEQENWLVTLSDTSPVRIVPFDGAAKERFRRVAERIHAALGQDVRVEHHGATILGISGQDEIDVYLPVAPDEFDMLVLSLKAFFGEPRSLYPGRRARFVTEEAGKHIDIFPINEACEDWKNLLIFESYLKVHPETLEQYRELKESLDGASVREYYRRKIEFINQTVKI